jgi:uncharacterized delta-60 repeat protein
MKASHHLTLVFLSLLSAILLGTTPVHAAPGDLDSLNANVGGGGVYATAVQPDGKTILAGGFNSVLGQPRNNIARLNADGTLDAGFNPNVSGFVDSGSVHSVAVQADGQILLGGYFYTVDGTTRFNIARLNADGTLDVGFNPGANSTVNSVAVQADGQILLGGSFTSVGGTTRDYIARLNTDGTLDAGFNPGANYGVHSVAVQADGQILLGGWFTSVGGTTRNGIARVAANGTLDAGFNPNANGSVYSVAVQADGQILLGGTFSTIGGTARNYVARVTANGTLDAGFNPNANSTVNSVAVQADGQILLGGWFTSVGGTTRNKFARLLNDPATQTLSATDTSQVIWTRGGSAPEIAQVTVEQSTDSGTTWTTLGSATRIGSTPNWLLTGLNLPPSVQLRARGRSSGGGNNGSSGLIEQVASFSGLLPPEINVTQASLLADGLSHVAFGSALVGSSAPLTFTITNPSTADLSNLVVTVDGTNSGDFMVSALSTTSIPVGAGTSTFTVIFSPTASGAKTAALHIASNVTGTQNPFDIILTGTGMNTPGPGDPDSLDANVSGSFVYATVVQPDGKTIIAGDFTSVLGQPRNNIARLNANGTLDESFNPNVSGVVICSAVQADGQILLGGIFTSVGGTPRKHIARLNADGTLDAGFNPNPSADGAVGSVAVQADGQILLGGRFTSVGDTTRNHIARVAANGTLDAGFNPNVVGIVVPVTVVQPDGKTIIAGEFSSVLGQPRNNIARLNVDGTLDAGFNPNVSGYVGSVAVQADGQILLGGDFTSVGGITRNRIARLNADGTLDAGFNPNANDYVWSVVVQTNGQILLGGSFTSVGGTTRNHIARVAANGTLDAGFNPNVSDAFGNVVYSVAVQADGQILLGGQFTHVGGNTRNLFARLLNEPATQTLSATDPSQVIWTRGGSAPEIAQVTVEQSTDSGTTWTPLGSATRMGSTPNWQLTGLNLPPSVQLRARGRSSGGNYNGSSGLIEQVASFSGLLAAPTISNITDQSIGVNTLTNSLPFTVGDADTPVAALSVSGTSSNQALVTDGNIFFGGSGANRTVTVVPETNQIGTVTISVSVSDGLLTVTDTFVVTVLVLAADIAVEQPFNNNLTDGGSKSFGNVAVGANSSLNFIIKNTGNANLTGLTISLDGADAGMFTVTANPTAPVSGPNGTTAFTVRFAPTSVGLKTAAIHIASNDPDESPFDITLTGGPPAAPEIAVERSGVNIADGGSVGFATATVGSPADVVFTVRNTGSAPLALNGTPLVVVGGTDAALFSVISPPAFAVGAGDSTTFIVRYAPLDSSPKTATLSLANNDTDEQPFDLNLTGAVLSFTTDTDGDGFSDAAELQMAALGYDWQVSQTALVNTFTSNANGLGYYTAAQVQALNLDVPLIQRDGLGQFKLTLGMKKSTDLVHFNPFPMNQPGMTTTINGEGKLEIQFTVPDNAAFFRLQAQ